MRKASQVMTTVQLNPRMAMNPKFRCSRFGEQLPQALLGYSHLQHREFAQATEVILVPVGFQLAHFESLGGIVVSIYRLDERVHA